MQGNRIRRSSISDGIRPQLVSLLATSAPNRPRSFRSPLSPVCWQPESTGQSCWLMVSGSEATPACAVALRRGSQCRPRKCDVMDTIPSRCAVDDKSGTRCYEVTVIIRRPIVKKNSCLLDLISTHVSQQIGVNILTSYIYMYI